MELSSTAQELKEKINVKSPLTITVYEKDKVTLRTVINTTIEDMTDNNLNTNAIKEKQEVEIIINNKIATKDNVITIPISPSQKNPLNILDVRINTKHATSKHLCQLLNLPSIFITSFFYCIR